MAGRVRQRVRGDEYGEEEERSSTSVGDSEHRAFLRFALSFNRAFRACSRRARTEEPERSAIGETRLRAVVRRNDGPPRNMSGLVARRSVSNARPRVIGYLREMSHACLDRMKNPRDGEFD